MVEIGWDVIADASEREGKKEEKPNSDGIIYLPFEKRSKGWIWAFYKSLC